MDYEKKYKEALERAKAMIDDLRKGEDILAVSEIEAMFPELAESEDERIRRELVEKISKLACGCFISEEQKQNFIAYLEKQKINTEGDFGRGYDCGYEACLNSHGAEWFEKQKEQKPKFYPGDVIKCTSRGSLWVRCKDGDNIRSDGHTACIGGGFELASEEEAVQFFQELNENGYQWDCIKGRPIKKEQKPVEIHIDNPNIEKFAPDMKITTSDSSADGDELLYVCNKSYKIGYRDGKRDAERKPAEYIPDSVKFSEGYKTGREVGFREGVESVKPAEWSEEDEEIFNNIIEKAKGGHWIEVNEISWLITRFKSLRPQSQGIYQQVVKRLRDMCDRYEQNGMFTDERARDFLGNVRVKCKDAIECAPILDEPNWKPTEEQMDSLRDTIVQTKGAER